MRRLRFPMMHAPGARPALAAAALGVMTGATPVQAEDRQDLSNLNADRVTEVEVGVQGDRTGASGWFANLSVPVAAHDTIRGALGYTNFDDFEVTRANGQVVFVEAEPAKDISLDYRHDFDSLGLNVGAEHWGNEDLLQVDDYRVGFDYQTKNSDWSLDLVRRNSTAVVRGVPNGPRDVGIDAWGVNAGFGYLTDPIDVYLSLTYFDYGDDLDVGPVGAHLGTRSPFAVGNTLLEESVLIGGRHQFELWSAGMEAAWYRGGVGSNETGTLAAIFDVAVSDRIELSFTVGGVGGDNVDTAAFGVVSLRCEFGRE